jgi:hypothetical protein
MIGTIRMFKGQHYWVGNTFTRQRPDGSLAVILVWASHCATCGDHFEFTAPAAASKWEPNRRCAVHKRPGHRVKGEAA